MYDVYINKYKNPNTGSVVTTEALMFSIPSAGSGFPISKPIVKQNEDSADNFQFSMDCNSYYYDALLPLKTIMRVEYDGVIIFMGRVLSITTSTVFNTKSVTCEGVLAYFNDTYYEGKQEKHRSKMTVEDYYEKILKNHNNQVPEKQIKKGTIGVTLPTDKEKYEPNSWSKSLSLLNNLTNSYGGHFCIRYSGKTPYLDWYKYYSRDRGKEAGQISGSDAIIDNSSSTPYNTSEVMTEDGIISGRPSVVIGRNILDISSEQNVNDMFTRIIPIGGSKANGNTIYIDNYKYKDKNGAEKTHSGKALKVTELMDIYSTTQLTDEFHDYKDYRDAESLFGIIYRTVDFSDATSKSKLWNLARKWVKECYFGLVSSFTVKAIDMHIRDNSYPQILIGECVDVTYKINQNGEETWVTKKLICKSIQYDLFNPENNSYTFGFPTDLLDHNNFHKKSSKSTASDDSAKKPQPSGKDDQEITWYKVYEIIGAVDPPNGYGGTYPAKSFYDYKELSGTVTVYDPDEIVDGTEDVTVGSNIEKYKSYWFTAKIIGKFSRDGDNKRVATRYVAVSNTRGIFAYLASGDPAPVKYWYSKKSGYTVDQKEPEVQSFETVAKLIEDDTDSTYGGADNASSFRSYGRISRGVKCYDPEKTNGKVPSAAAGNEDEAFVAKVIGKFKVGNVTMKYVAISSSYGIFAFYYGSSQYQPVRHWYSRGKGMTYTNVDNTTSDDDGNVKIGGGGTEGSLSIGDKGGDEDDDNNWRVTINKELTYKNDKGETVRLPKGSIKVSDLQLPEIPSFKTKIGVFDIVIAGVVMAKDIESERAYIQQLNSNEISAGTRVAAVQVKCNNLITSTVQCSDVSLPTGPNGQQYHLTDCFVDGSLSESNGKITLTLNRASRSNAWTGSFNMADTQFYKDAVSASWEDCWNQMGINLTKNTELTDDFPSIQVYPRGKKSPNGIAVNNMDKAVTITANMPGLKNDAWNAARAIITNSSTNRGVPVPSHVENVDETYYIRVPKQNYGDSSHYNSYALTVSDIKTYEIGSTKHDVVNVKIGEKVVYRKKILLQALGTITPTGTSKTYTATGDNQAIKSFTIPGLSISLAENPTVSGQASGENLNSNSRFSSALTKARANNAYVILSLKVNSSITKKYYIKASEI